MFPLVPSNHKTYQAMLKIKHAKKYLEPINFYNTCCMKVCNKRKKLIRKDNMDDDQDEDVNDMLDNYKERLAQIEEIADRNYHFIMLPFPPDVQDEGFKAKYVGIPPFRMATLKVDIASMDENVSLQELNKYFHVSCLHN